MNTNYQVLRITGVALFVGLAFEPAARAAEIDDLKAEIRVMQQSIDQMQKKILKLEDENQQQKQKTAAVTKTAPAPPAEGFSGMARPLLSTRDRK